MAINKPFLKWVGGKSRQIAAIQKNMPAGERLIEPFVGGGSVFLNFRFEHYLLADINADLINLYQQLLIAPDAVLEKAKRLFSLNTTQEGYLKVRQRFNDGRNTLIEHAAAFLYLNKWGFNGLVRYNLKGDFNVGFGHLKDRKFPELPKAEIEGFIALGISSASFVQQDFEVTIAQAGAGDVVYCDPPYASVPKTDKPHKLSKVYTGEHFCMDEQFRLIECCVSAHNRGAKIVINNALNEDLVGNYIKAGFMIQRMEARRSIAPTGLGRGNVHDVIGCLL